MFSGKKLQDIRKEKGLSQEELGKMLLKSADVISSYERNVSIPQPETINMLAKALQVDPEKFEIETFDFKKFMDKRISTKLSREDMAELLNVTPDDIKNYETGKAAPDSDLLSQICELLNVSADYFDPNRQKEAIILTNESFIKFLKNLRITKGATRKDIASKIGIKIGSLDNYIYGNTLPPAEIIDKICKAYDVKSEFSYKPKVVRNTNKKLRAIFAKKVKEFRLDKKMTKIDFGKKVGVSSDQIWHWENGDYIPANDKVQLLCNAFNLPREYFLPDIPDDDTDTVVSKDSTVQEKVLEETKEDNNTAQPIQEDNTDNVNNIEPVIQLIDDKKEASDNEKMKIKEPTSTNMTSDIIDPLYIQPTQGTCANTMPSFTPNSTYYNTTTPLFDTPVMQPAKKIIQENITNVPQENTDPKNIKQVIINFPEGYSNISLSITLSK